MSDLEHGIVGYNMVCNVLYCLAIRVFYKYRQFTYCAQYTYYILQE